MKPCFRRRRPIAELVVGALDEGAAATLRQHLARCEGCRRYWGELARVTRDLAGGAEPSRLEASATFHQRVAARVRAGAEAPARFEGLLRSPWDGIHPPLTRPSATLSHPNGRGPALWRLVVHPKHLAVSWGLWSRRGVVVPALAVLALTLVGWIAFRGDPEAAGPGAAEMGVAVGVVPERRLASSLVQYRAAAAQSLDHLDALLDRQGRQRLPGVPDYTATGVREGGGAY